MHMLLLSTLGCIVQSFKRVGLVQVFHHVCMGIWNRQAWRLQQQNRMSENPSPTGTPIYGQSSGYV